MGGMSEKTPTETITELIKGIKIAMLTQINSNGRLVSHPMATQDVDFDGDVWFIAERNSEKVLDLAGDNRVNVAYSGKGSWVSLSGQAQVVDDPARLKEYWGMFTDAWMEGGPESPNNILIHIVADSAEYWGTPGSAVTQIANFVKSKAKGERIEGNNDAVEL